MENDFVEAIEDGKIVRVSESYARLEGLLVLRKLAPVKDAQEAPNYYPQKLSSSASSKKEKDYRKSFKAIIDKKPDWKEHQVLKELVENFQWQIRTERRKKNLTRRQLAKLINDTDENLQIIESGRLPSPDFLLINKIQKVFNINLRKDGRNYDLTAKEIMDRAPPQPPKSAQKEAKSEDKDLDIEFIDEED